MIKTSTDLFIYSGSPAAFSVGAAGFVANAAVSFGGGCVWLSSQGSLAVTLQ